MSESWFQWSFTDSGRGLFFRFSSICSSCFLRTYGFESAEKSLRASCFLDFSFTLNFISISPWSYFHPKSFASFIRVLVNAPFTNLSFNVSCKSTIEISKDNYTVSGVYTHKKFFEFIICVLLTRFCSHFLWYVYAYDEEIAYKSHSLTKVIRDPIEPEFMTYLEIVPQIFNSPKN